jgi:hypothetical protein
MAMTSVIPIIAAGSACSSASSCGTKSGCGSCTSAAGDDPSARLQQEGWILRTTIGEPRLSEVAENYRAMGYEVHVEYFGEIAAAGTGGCTTCFDAADRSQASQAWGSVYVRPAPAAGNTTDELY